MIFKASRNAEDVYAAAVLYTDDALQRVQHIMQDTTDALQDILKKAQDDMKTQKVVIRENQSELKSQLQDMVDTEKYLKLIEERNHELEKEREKEKKEPREEKKSSYQAIKPEIRINPEYFKKAGIPLEDEEPEEDAAEGKKEIPEVTVDLDAEYFKWKAKEKDNKKK